MRSLKLAPEPTNFDSLVRRPGIAALQQKGVALGQSVQRGFKWDKIDYWKQSLRDLAAAYNNICCYSCFRVNPAIGSGSVDHFEPKSRRPDLAYEWRNHRFVSLKMNGRKGIRSIADPIGLTPGTFAISFIDFEVYVPEEVGHPVNALALQTIKVLDLNVSEMREERRRAYQNYITGQTSAHFLKEDAPFLFEEAVRQGLITTGV